MNTTFASEALDPLAHTTRQRIETAIEGLVAILDAMDSDPDLEPDSDDEPYLGWPNDRPTSVDYNTAQDREEDAGDEGEPDVENEPSLGSSGSIDQTHWAQGYSHLSEEHEPSLGWQNAGSQMPHILAIPALHGFGLHDRSLDREQEAR